MAGQYDYDLIVIGAGIAGMVSSVTANGLGKRVAVVEKQKVGGNCTNTTCIPSKALIKLSHANRQAERLERMGVRSIAASGVKTEKVLAHIRSVAKRAYAKDLPETFERIGIRMFAGKAEFVDPHRIRVDGRVVSADRFIIATGTRPFIPPIPGLREIDYLTNETLYELNELPKSILVLGGGVDGLEYASAFVRLGMETTLVEMAPRLLPMADRELVERLAEVLRDEGIRLMNGTKAVALRQEHGNVALDYELGDGQRGNVKADRVLVAVGRRPDLEELVLDKAGVDHTPRGIITDNKLRTSASHIYACGDIAGPYQLATTAEYQGIIAAGNAFLPIKRRVDYRNNVYVIFTEPPLAYIGLTEAEAREQYGEDVKVYRLDYSGMRRAMIDGFEEGMAKFICDRRGRLIGAHILGEAAPEVIHEVQVIKALNKPLHKLNAVTHGYPTYAQALVGRASQLAFLDKMKDSFFVNAALNVLPGFANRLNLARDRLTETEPDASDRKTARLDVVIEAATSPRTEIRVNAVHVAGEACVVELPEDLTEYDEGPILAACASSGSRDPDHLILNFTNVRRMNGLGAGMLVKLNARARRRGSQLSAFGLPKGLRDVLRVTELDQVIRIYDRETDALLAAGVTAGQGSKESMKQDAGEVDLSNWARPVAEIMVPPMPPEARNLNVSGLRAGGPVNGFGQLWQKVFRLPINNPRITPEAVIVALEENFPAFQPSFNAFFPSRDGIQPGAIVLIDSSTPGGPVSTGVVVLYADERSFTFMTPQGHPEAGFVSFSAFRAGDRTIAQIHGLARANDPAYETAFRAVGSKIQRGIWTHVLRSLAAHLGVADEITVEETCVDSRMQWSQAKNIYYNAQMRTLANEPFRLVTKQRKVPARKSSARKNAEYDAIVVGSGPNGLAAAITIARAGRSVLVVEAADTIGGGTRTEELTLPGVRHDVCAAIHPLAMASPFFRSLDLSAHGLEWIQPPVPLAHPLDKGTAVLLERSPDVTAQGLGKDAQPYRRLLGPAVRNWHKLVYDLLKPLGIPRYPLPLLWFAPHAMRSAVTLAGKWFTSVRARALFAGNSAHSILPLEQPSSAAFGVMLSMLGHAVGWPIAKGGSQSVADALGSYLRSLGGEIKVGTPVSSLDDLPSAHAVLFDVTPKQLARIASSRLPNDYRNRLEAHQYGPGVFKLDWALNSPIPWKDPSCLQAGTVHVGGTLEEIAAAERDVWQGIAPDKPFVILSQPSLFDPTRAPNGKHTAWAYCHVPHASDEDMTRRIEAQVERFAPGFQDTIIARHTMSPADMEAHNPNYIGGDIVGGIQSFQQLFVRPLGQWRAYSTPVKGLYVCSSSMPPGGGVHGMCGHLAGQVALREVL